VEAIETRGDRELVFRLNEPSPAFPNLLAYYSSPVIKPDGFDAQGRITRLTATGPFRLNRWKRGERIELESFPEYWGEKPKFQRIVFRTLLDAQSRLLSLRTGEIDAVADVGGILPEQIDSLTGLPDILLKRQEVATTHYLFFNGRRFPLDRPETRCWIAGLVDRSAWISALTRGGGRVAHDFFTPLAREWAFGNVAPPPGRKPAPDRRPWVILLHNGTIQRWPYLELAQLLQDRLGREGFSARLQVLEAGPYQETLKQGTFDLVIQPNTLMTGDPDFFYSYYFHSRGPYRWGFDSPELDRLIEGARREMDPGRRRAAYRDLGERLNRDLPVLPLYHDLSLFAVRRSVRNLDMDAFFRPRLVEAEPAEAPGTGRV
jgi:peptide/nickel transport system substrate-binding protein